MTDELESPKDYKLSNLPAEDTASTTVWAQAASDAYRTASSKDESLDKLVLGASVAIPAVSALAGFSLDVLRSESVPDLRFRIENQTSTKLGTFMSNLVSYYDGVNKSPNLASRETMEKWARTNIDLKPSVARDAVSLAKIFPTALGLGAAGILGGRLFYKHFN